MPVTKKEKFVFLLMMAFAMTAAMESYNLMLQGVSPRELARALAVDLPMMCMVVMAVQAFCGGPLARALARRIVPPERNRAAAGVCISVCTVLVMCPLMSLAATLIFKCRGPNFPQVWLSTFLVNLPAAFLWQMLAAGPLVRKAFARIFRS